MNNVLEKQSKGKRMNVYIKDESVIADLDFVAAQEGISRSTALMQGARMKVNQYRKSSTYGK